MERLNLYIVFGIFIVVMLVWGYMTYKETMARQRLLEEINPPWLQEAEDTHDNWREDDQGVTSNH